MVSALITQIGVPILASILSESVNKMDHPVAKNASHILSELDKAIAAGQVSQAELNEANRHAEKMARIKAEEARHITSGINESLQAEINSDDKYVRRMRPTFGYLMAFTWAAQMFALAYVIVFRTSEAHLVLRAVESLGMIWTVGLSVLGIYVYKRSEDKKLFQMPEMFKAALPSGDKTGRTAQERKQPKSSAFND